MVHKMDESSVIKAIETAFAGVLLEDGIGIYEAEVIDDYGGEEERQKAKLKDLVSWRNWQEIPDEVLRSYYTTFCFVDSKGFKFLIPAYMRFALKYCKEDGSASIDSTIYALEPSNYNFDGFVNLLTSEQKAAIAKFLEYFILEIGERWVDADAASRMYESYWCRYQ